MIGSVRGTVVERTATGEVLVEVGGVGYRVHVPASALADVAPGRRRVPLHPPARARGRDGALRVPDPRRARHVRGADRHDRGGAQARARDVVGALTERVCVARCWRTISPRSPLVPGVGKRTAQRLLVELKARLEVPELDLTETGGGPAPRTEVRAALAGLGYGPDEVRDVVAQLPGGRFGRGPPPRGAQAPGGDPCVGRHVMRDELMPRRRPIRSRPRRRPRSGRAGSTSSSASPRLKEHLEILLAGRARRAARPPTTSCSPGRPASARPRCRGSSPPRWTSACASPAVPRSSGRATSRPSSPTSTTATCSSSTRSTAFPRPVEEVLYPAMEDFQLDIVIGKGPSAAIDPPRAARASPSSAPPPAPASSPGRSATASASSPVSTTTTSTTSSPSSSAPPASSASRSSTGGAVEIARRSRGTPRIANRLLKRVRDYAEVRADGAVTTENARAALELFEVDELGLDKVDRAILSRAVRDLRRAAGGPPHPGGGGGRGARDGGRGLRAVPAEGGHAAAHAPRPGRHARAPTRTSDLPAPSVAPNLFTPEA